jgi:magnesium-transporting ATPase (P-type)
VGAIVGVLFSDIVLHLLNPLHASLLGLATSGILISFLPVKKTDDLDQIFRQRMQRFITLWISFTVFVFALILPYITSIIFGIILILSSIIILGAILAVYIYRIEKKQKISIKW